MADVLLYEEDCSALSCTREGLLEIRRRRLEKAHEIMGVDEITGRAQQMLDYPFSRTICLLKQRPQFIDMRHVKSSWSSYWLLHCGR
jgi:hypothetical protein